MNPIKITSSGTQVANKPKAYTKHFKTEEMQFKEIPKITQARGYSAMIFKGGYRLKKNVTGFCPLVILDADTDLKKGKISYTIKQLKHQLDGLETIIVTTLSHSKTEHRLRVILPLDTTEGITTANYRDFLKTAIRFMGLDPDYFDNACYGIDRQYAPNPNQEVYHLKGESLPTAYLLSKIPPPEPPKQEYHPVEGDIGGTYQEQRDYIFSHTTKEITAHLLQRAGYTVRDYKVFYDNRDQTPLSIHQVTGLLRDFSLDKTYSLIDTVRNFTNQDDTSIPYMSEKAAIAIIVKELTQ